MFPIIQGNQIQKIDVAYCSAEGISSLELMERAAKSFVDWLIPQMQNSKGRFYVFSGPGNNGGDGVAIARLLKYLNHSVHLIYIKDVDQCSNDFQRNFERLPEGVEICRFDLWNGKIEPDSIIIDAIFGVGINRPLEGTYLRVIQTLNKQVGLKISIDIPSGLPADQASFGEVFKADHTATFQFPKLSLLFPEHALVTGEHHVLDIGMSDSFLNKFENGNFYLKQNDILGLHRTFHRFSHKGNFGKVLFLGSEQGKFGAINLSGYASLRTGSGLVHLAPQIENTFAFNTLVPELMLYQDSSKSSLYQFDAIGIGPGWGMGVEKDYFKSIFVRFKRPMVIDADGLNLLAKYPELKKEIPENSILTPHLKEFERLVGESANHLERIEKASSLAKEFKVIVILKGAHSLIALPDGRRIFNSSGNQYMATAGSGDVLTGMLTSFLGQGYLPEHAAICGVFHHGLAGEIASKSKRRGMTASDIIEAIPDTFIKLNLL
ncbi:yjeF-like protein, hydroxyethylthiazole kinase-related protein [Belliella baltica DSM 15883]|uniref:Bifunctional NAD(P)H-hydrate repair enzyme n=1 Tax=Belliella baltica (strain DSM 15883 / CIP 108006 / LMG 21964 / BA134) TaxID=866536 RepID=I3Z5I0_BELBD|nr:bifunctional ADP-dependent NAD(P)H-hydrate dehydratase/NAD(P)H-hydrate epimerase [Belliella baltica]AFL84498.1 yjeF-like protein, hydroxyethylthiazole kinase-related protein [Belliella baltica DSM 15883]